MLFERSSKMKKQSFKTIPITLDKKILSQFLKQRRQNLKITQAELAKYCNLSREGIQKIESGTSDVQISTIIKISKILDFKINIEVADDTDVKL